MSPSPLFPIMRVGDPAHGLGPMLVLRGFLAPPNPVREGEAATHTPNSACWPQPSYEANPGSSFALPSRHPAGPMAGELYEKF